MRRSTVLVRPEWIRKAVSQTHLLFFFTLLPVRARSPALPHLLRRRMLRIHHGRQIQLPKPRTSSKEIEPIVIQQHIFILRKQIVCVFSFDRSLCGSFAETETATHGARSETDGKGVLVGRVVEAFGGAECEVAAEA